MGELGFLHLLLLSKEIYCPFPGDSCIFEVISNLKAKGLPILAPERLRPRVLGREIGHVLWSGLQLFTPTEWRPHLYVGRGASTEWERVVRCKAL